MNDMRSRSAALLSSKMQKQVQQGLSKACSGTQHDSSRGLKHRGTVRQRPKEGPQKGTLQTVMPEVSCTSSPRARQLIVAACSVPPHLGERRHGPAWTRKPCDSVTCKAAKTLARRHHPCTPECTPGHSAWTQASIAKAMLTTSLALPGRRGSHAKCQMDPDQSQDAVLCSRWACCAKHNTIPFAPHL